MRKFILFCLLILSPALAVEELTDVGIAKYAVLEVLQDNTPLREKDNENAKRLTHLYKDAVLFADKQTKDYYRVELKDNFYAFVNKKYVEVQAVIPEKRFENVEKIQISRDKKRYSAKIETKAQNAFIAKETETGLDFTLYDNHFDPTEIKISSSKRFKITDEISNELTLSYKTKKPLFGYSVEKYDKGYILSIKKPPKIKKKKPLKNIVVVVDPGHGGKDSGACCFNLAEKTINLQISKALKKELLKQGAEVFLTRKGDDKVELYDRVNFAKEKEADILLSIHQNSLANRKLVEKKHGVGTYYYNNQSKALAQSLQKELIEATGFKDDKVNFASFALTRPTEQISVLIECGYIIHEEEAKKISDKKFQKIIAKAIVRGCENYLTEAFSK